MVFLSLFVMNVVNAADTLFFPPEWGEIESVEVGFSANEVGSDFVYALMFRFDAGGAAPVIVRRDGKVELEANSFTPTTEPSYNGYWFTGGLWRPVAHRRTSRGYEWVSLNLHKVVSPNEFKVDYNIPMNYIPSKDITVEKSDGKYLIYLKGELVTILR